MIYMYSLFLVFAIITYFACYRLSFYKRILIAVSVFIVTALILTVILVKTGDKPTAGALTITPEELNREGK